MSGDSSACAVYAALEDAQKAQGAGLVSIEAYDVYKVAREEELAAYRSLCRALIMHHGPTLPKAANRMLEDLREQLAISEERGSLELEAAEHDPLIQGVQRSGILSRRADFFDGVDDITLDTAMDRARSDGATVYAPAMKYAKHEGGGASGSNAQSQPQLTKGPGAGPGRKRTNINASILKISKEVEKAAGELLYTSDSQRRADLLQQLAKHKETLVQLQHDGA